VPIAVWWVLTTVNFLKKVILHFVFIVYYCFERAAGDIERGVRGVVNAVVDSDEPRDQHEPAVPEEPNPGVAVGTAADDANDAAAVAQPQPARLRCAATPAPATALAPDDAAAASLHALHHSHRQYAVSTLVFFSFFSSWWWEYSPNTQ
jgi:hypothetical protein